MRRTSTRNYRQWGYIGFNGGGSDTSRVPHGEPYAGKLHVRFDEGAGVPHGASRSTLHPIVRADKIMKRAKDPDAFVPIEIKLAK